MMSLEQHSYDLKRGPYWKLWIRRPERHTIVIRMVQDLKEEDTGAKRDARVDGLRERNSPSQSSLSGMVCHKLRM